jgi:hypothetical protein
MAISFRDIEIYDSKSLLEDACGVAQVQKDFCSIMINLLSFKVEKIDAFHYIPL